MTCAILTTGTELLLKNKNENEITCLAIKEKLLENIWNLFCAGYDEFYLNCEYGVPLWAAEIICALKMYNHITLHIVIPYEEQAVLWLEEWRNRYYMVHEKADTVVIAHKRFYCNCYDDTDKMMIDKSDSMLIFGKPSNKSYAFRCGKKMHCFYI